MAYILVIDDSEFARQMTSETLKVDGNEVIEAKTGQEGIELAEVSFPGMEGESRNGWVKGCIPSGTYG